MGVAARINQDSHEAMTKTLRPLGIPFERRIRRRAVNSALLSKYSLEEKGLLDQVINFEIIHPARSPGKPWKTEMGELIFIS